MASTLFDASALRSLVIILRISSNPPYPGRSSKVTATSRCVPIGVFRLGTLDADACALALLAGFISRPANKATNISFFILFSLLAHQHEPHAAPIQAVFARPFVRRKARGAGWTILPPAAETIERSI